MKKIFTLSVLCLSIKVSAQQVIYSQNFENFQGYQLIGWTQEHNTYAYPWTTGLAYLIGGCFVPPTNNTRVAGLTDNFTPQQSPVVCGSTHADSNVFAYTPSIALTDTGLILSYDSYFLETQVNGKKEAATVEISDDNANSWTIVQHVPGNDPNDFATYYIPLSAYNNIDSIRLGFRYQDSAQHMNGWMIDNIRIFKPVHKDLMIRSVSPADSMLRYVVINNSIQHQVTVFNNGIDTITSFTVKYQLGSGLIHAYTVAGVQIPRFTEYTFMHPVPDTLFNVQREQLTTWVEMNGDENIHNDTLISYMNGVAFKPVKKLVIEEGTGTWSIYGPRGWVAMNQAASSDQNVALVSIHTVDPMQLPDYSDFMLYLHWNFVPYILLDRRVSISNEHFDLPDQIIKQKDYFGFADINVSGHIAGNDLTVEASVTPAINLYGDKRLALIITEDNVTGTDTGYSQRNRYAGNAYGPMGGFENKPDPVPATAMHYNFVARQAFPTPEGDPGMLPDTMYYSHTYHYTFHTSLDPSWNRTYLKAYVFLVNHDDSSILNSQQYPWPLAVNDPGALLFSDAYLYPNPANETTCLYFNLVKDELLQWQVTDISGRSIITRQQQYTAGSHRISIPVDRLSQGLYLVTVATKSGRQTFKLQVLHP